jgi:hypothetical protein
MSIATEYANRLNRGNMRDEAIKRLVEGYPEHEFIIDREEAITLFNNVREPTELEEELMYLLEDYVATEIQKHAGREPSIEWLSEDMAPDEEAEDKIDIASKTKEEPPMSPAIKEGPEDGSNDVAGITRMPIPGETRPDSKKISRDDGEVIGEAEPTPTQAKPENTVRSTNRVSGQERAE